MQSTDKISQIKLEKKRYCNRDALIGLTVIILLAVLTGLRFDYYYDLNDDMMIKDITAGIYTGSPDGHNIQMLFPMGALISMFYRFYPVIPWYAVFFVLCNLFAVHMILVCSLSYFKKTYSKWLAALAGGILIFSLFFYYLVFVQYTVTAALLGGAAAFRLYTTDQELSGKCFIRKNIISVILVIIAFQIRTESLLLIFPLVCAAAVCKWGNEKIIFCKESFQKYLTLLSLILAGMGISIAVNAIAYSGSGWDEFNRFFDARTEIYDFLGGAPSYEENEAFYESLGFHQSEYTLLQNYNFGIDHRIDAEMLEKIAEYGTEIRAAENQPFLGRIKRTLDNNWDLILGKYMTVPWYGIIALMYILLVGLALYGRDASALLKIPLLIFIRSGLWFYLIYRGRVVERVSTSLYLVEFLVLTVFLLEQYRINKISSRNKRKKRSMIPGEAVRSFLLAAVFAFTLYLSSGVFARVSAEYDRREEVNQEYLSLLDYCKENSNHFYFLDVYSTVAYSEKMFRNVDNDMRNYDFLGGWTNKSPLAEEKLRAFGMDSIQSGILDKRNVYVISHKNYETVWLEEFMKDMGIPVRSSRVDSIKDMGEVVFNVYRVERVRNIE